MSTDGTHGGLDQPTQLREWGTDRVHVLPPPEAALCYLSTQGDALRLSASKPAFVHAYLRSLRGTWRISQGMHGVVLRENNVPCREFSLIPGSEVHLGSRVLIAESPRWIALRAFCCRILGWGDSRVVDRALRSISSASRFGLPLVLRGGNGLPSIAFALHQRILGEEHPFALCDKHGGGVSRSLRPFPRFSRALDALNAAAGGTLCLASGYRPADEPMLLEQLHSGTRPLQLVVCIKGEHRIGALVGPVPITIPSLNLRRGDVGRIIDAYAQEARAALNAPPWCFSEYDAQWVANHESSLLPEMEKAIWRFTTINLVFGNVAAAKRLLGIAYISLRRWLHQRRRWQSAVARGVVTRRRQASLRRCEDDLNARSADGG